MRTKRFLFSTSLFVVSLLVGVFAQVSPAPSANLALTPPMGWNSWNKFACNVSEDMIKNMADAVVKSGMKDAGYVYVNIDDCWQVSRDANGNVVADPQRFPHGMKAVGDYIHSLGLKFGVYSDAGSKTCAGRPGGLGHEYQDAIQYAAWGVDYLKYDWCNTTTQDAKASYANIRAALDASGRPIVLSICEWGTAKPWLMGQRSRRKPVAHDRRHSGPMGRPGEVARRELLLKRRALHHRSAGRIAILRRPGTLE